jgi:serine/threonine protein kinase
MVESNDIKSTVKELMQINHIEKIALKDLVLKKKIGEGGQAKVYKGSWEGETVAVKVLEEVDWKCLAHEIVIIANLQHSGIPKFYGIVVEDKILSLVFQYINGKTLDDYKHDEISHDIRVKIMKDLGKIMEYIHSNKFIHRDLKPENLMWDAQNQKLYLIDFGIAKVCTNSSNTVTRAKGTLHYIAPECFDYSELDGDNQIISTISPACDVWSYGCILSWLFSGSLPWINKYKESSIQKQLTLKTNFPIPDNIKDASVVKVISMCTKTSLNERWTMVQVNEFLSQI